MAYAPKRAANPGALGLTIGLNAAAVVAVAAWNPQVFKEIIPPFQTVPIGELKPPPPPPASDEKADTKPANRIDNPRTTVTKATKPDDWTTTETEFGTTTIDPGRGETIIIDPPPLPPQIVKRAATMATSSAEMQPPYPPALQRGEVQGSVTVRVLVGTDGRPRDIVLVRTDDPGFFAAAKSWGLRHWRFKPASEDESPVESWFTLTVRFTID